MAKRQPPPVAPPPECPACTSPTLCKAPAWREKRGANCQGRATGPDACDCLNACGDDPWLKDGRARHCAAFWWQNPECKPQPIFPRMICTTDIVAGPFTPLPYDWW